MSLFDALYNSLNSKKEVLVLHYISSSIHYSNSSYDFTRDILSSPISIVVLASGFLFPKSITISLHFFIQFKLHYVIYTYLSVMNWTTRVLSYVNDFGQCGVINKHCCIFIFRCLSTCSCSLGTTNQPMPAVHSSQKVRYDLRTQTPFEKQERQ